MTNKATAQIHVELGDVYFKNDEFKKAEEEYDKAINLDYDLKEDLYLHRGKIHMVFRRYNEAIRNFKKFIKLGAGAKKDEALSLINKCEGEIEKEKNRREGLPEIKKCFQKIREFKVEELVAEKEPIINKLYAEINSHQEVLHKTSKEIFQIYEMAKYKGYDELCDFALKEWEKCDVKENHFEYIN